MSVLTFSHLKADVRLPCVSCKAPTFMRGGYDPQIPGIPRLEKPLCDECLNKGERVVRLIGRLLDS